MKIRVYEKGGFFLTHKDSEKEKGMFGTLIIGLPSSFTGGELVVSFEGVKETADFASRAGDYKIPYAAFYADCDHEVKPVLSGSRVCLVYNQAGCLCCRCDKLRKRRYIIGVEVVRGF